MQTFRFRALVTLHEGAPDVPAARWPIGRHTVMVHACRLGRQDCYRHFPAAVCKDDGQPLHSGERAVVTVTLADDDAAKFFGPGQNFTLWTGTDVGHGIVSRRAFVPSGPC